MADNSSQAAPALAPGADQKLTAKQKKANAAASRDKHRQIEKAHRDVSARLWLHCSLLLAKQLLSITPLYSACAN
jgi:hypothetical protein